MLNASTSQEIEAAFVTLVRDRADALFVAPDNYSVLLNRLREIEAKPESRKYKSKRLTELTLKPTSMYQVELASIADI